MNIFNNRKEYLRQLNQLSKQSNEVRQLLNSKLGIVKCVKSNRQKKCNHLYKQGRVTKVPNQKEM